MCGRTDTVIGDRNQHNGDAAASIVATGVELDYVCLEVRTIPQTQPLQHRWELDMFACTILTPRQHITATTKRILLIVTLAILLSVTLITVAQPVPVSAAPVAASSGRQDRRPDRERPVVTSSSLPSGGTSQQGSNGTTQTRPRLVRR